MGQGWSDGATDRARDSGSVGDMQRSTAAVFVFPHQR